MFVHLLPHLSPLAVANAWSTQVDQAMATDNTYRRFHENLDTWFTRYTSRQTNIQTCWLQYFTPVLEAK